MTMHAPWTDEDIKIAQDMYTEGKSFADIGQRNFNILISPRCMDGHVSLLC